LSGADLRWKALKNTTAQVIGRNLVAVSRLVLAGIIVRAYGRVTFGQYSLVFGILSIVEWIVDFGATEVFVREICRRPERRVRLLRMMAAAKFLQVPAAFAVLAAALLAMRYPFEIFRAGLVGGASVIFFAGVLTYRVIFKAGLMIEREVAAELLSVLAMIPLVELAYRHGGGLIALMCCHFVSRGIFFLGCFMLGRNQYIPSVTGVRWKEIRWTLQASSAIGVIALLAGIYETLDILILSKLGTLSEVAFYSGAQRFTAPLLLALSSVGATLYPIAASYWPNEPQEFGRACQRGLDTVMVLAGLALCSVMAGAEFFMGLLGGDLQAGAPVLRILVLLCFVKAVTSTIGPILYIVHAQRNLLRFIAVTMAVKLVVICLLARPFGYLGVAVGSLVIEVFLATLPVVYLFQRFSRLHIQWHIPLKIAAIALAAGLAPRLLSINGLSAAIAAPLLYTPAVFFTGAVRFADLQMILRLKRA
jgi:O-antigen/teichoic acid export membrane protein